MKLYTNTVSFVHSRETDGIRLAYEREIAAMKMLAISGQIKRQKDYWELKIMDILEELNNLRLENK